MRKACICDGYEGLTCDMAGKDCVLWKEDELEPRTGIVVGHVLVNDVPAFFIKGCTPRLGDMVYLVRSVSESSGEEEDDAAV